MKKLLCAALALCVSYSAAFAAPPKQPIIGISGVNANSDSVRAMITQVAASGGTPLFLSNYTQRNSEEDIKKIDGLIIMGNTSDIDPKKYDAEQHKETVNEMDTPEGRARAAYEYDIMKRALVEGIPLLGICGGEQRLNVLQGGSLHQHVPDLVGHTDHAQHKNNIAPFIPVVPVSIQPGTTLAQIADNIDSLYVPGREADKTLMENSMHHQAVHKVGNGLRVAAYSDEFELGGEKHRLIEAIEADPQGPFKNQFVLGVQWHPEFSASPLGPKITARLVKEAEKIATGQERKLSPEDIQKENRLSAASVKQ